MKKVLVENKDNGEFVVLINPLGCEKFGFLGWDDLIFFKDKNKAEEFLRE